MVEKINVFLYILSPIPCNSVVGKAEVSCTQFLLQNSLKYIYKNKVLLWPSRLEASDGIKQEPTTETE